MSPAAALLELVLMTEADPELRRAVADLDGADTVARIKARSTILGNDRAVELLRAMGRTLPAPDLGSREVER